MTAASSNASPVLGAAAEACEARAHDLYFERHDWAGALLQWQIRAKLGPPTIETQLALAHCEIVMGVDRDHPEIGLADPVAASNRRQHDYAQLIRSCASAYLMEGEGGRAAKLARLLAAVDPHFRSVYERQILPSAAAVPIDIPDPPVDPTPLPFERALPLSESDAEAVLARHADCRVLLFARHADRSVQEDTLCRYLRTSVEAVGLPIRIVESHSTDPDVVARVPAMLREAIDGFRPHVIVVLDALTSGASAYPHTQPAILSALHDARRRLGAKVVFSYTDAWYDGMPALFDAIVEHADLFHVIFAGVRSRVTPRVAAKLFCLPFPCPDPRVPGAPAPARHRDAGFVGGLSWSNQSRLAWWAEISRLGLPIEVRFRNIAGMLTAADYAELIASYPISVDFTARITGDQVLTLRALEAPWYGSLLLSEEAADTAYFMRPYEHYVPFATLHQLAGRLRLLLDDAPRRERITRAGTAWVKRQFGARPFWARLLHRLDSTPAVAATLPDVPPGAARLSIPSSPATYAALARPLALPA
jgi:hypothetical protein